MSECPNRVQHVPPAHTAGGIRAECLSFACIRVLSLVLQTLSFVVFARVLSPDGYGEVSLVLAWTSMGSILLQFGMPTLIVREVAIARVAGQWGIIRGLIVYVATVFLGISGLVVASGTILATAGLTHSLGHTWPLLACGMILLVFTILLALTTSLFRGLGFGTMSHVPDLIFRPLATLVGVLAVSSAVAPGESRTVPAMATLVAGALVATCGSFTLFARAWKLISGHAAECSPRTWIRAAIPMALTSSLYVALVNVDIVFLGAMRPESEVGCYRIASQIASLLVMMLAASKSVVAPRYAELLATGDMAQLQRVCAATSFTAGCWACCGYLGILVGGSTMIRWIFGAAYEPAMLPLLVLGLGEVFNAATGPVGILLSMGGHERDTFRGVFIALLVKVAISLALIPTLGPLGAAIATTVSTILWNVVLWIRVRERFGIDVSPRQALVSAAQHAAFHIGHIHRRNAA